MEHKDVPYVVFEGVQTRNERITKRLILALIIAVVLLFISNALWLYAWSQYDYVASNSQVDLSTDGGGDANFIGNDGDIINGED